MGREVLSLNCCAEFSFACDLIQMLFLLFPFTILSRQPAIESFSVIARSDSCCGCGGGRLRPQPCPHLPRIGTTGRGGTPGGGGRSRSQPCRRSGARVWLPGLWICPTDANDAQRNS